MPVPSQAIGSTNPKLGTFQFDAHRFQAIPLKIPVVSGVTSVSNNRIVSLQREDSTETMYAVLSPVALSGFKIIGWGVLEEALQSGGVQSIAPNPRNYVDGDLVTVLRYPNQVYMVDIDPLNPPTIGVGTAYLDDECRLSSVSSASAVTHRLVKGAVFDCVPGVQMSNQLKENCMYFQMYSTVDP